MVFPAIGTGFANPDGSLNEKILDHYGRIAQAGSGLIITEIIKIDEDTGRTMPNQLSAADPSSVDKLKPLAQLIHSHGAKVLGQLQHPGLEANPLLVKDQTPVGPSRIQLKDRSFSRELSEREIQVLINKFAMGAKFIQDAGFDGVELHAAHGYLLAQFLSPDTNKRTDQYGGSLYERASIIGKIVEAIRQFCGEDFLISIRFSGDDFLEEGLDQKDGLRLADFFQDLGVDLLNVSSGTPRSIQSASTIIEPNSFEEGWKAYLGQAIKARVDLPVIACANIKSPQMANQILEDQACDLVALGRAQLADYDFLIKAGQGEDDLINKCISCRKCIKDLGRGKALNCPLNKDL